MKNENNFLKIKNLGKNIIQDFIGLHHQVYVDESILIYILNILSETRSNEKLVLGASPRAGEHLLYAAKANAMINGRDYVIPDDVKNVLPKVIGHRIILSAESEFEGLSSEKILADIINNIDVSELFSEKVEATI